MGWGRVEPRGFSSRLAQQSSDKAYQEETHLTAESLVLAGRHVLQAARQLQGQPFSPSHREVLAAAAKGILTETAKVTPEGMVLKGVVGKDADGEGTKWPLCWIWLRSTSWGNFVQ